MTRVVEMLTWYILANDTNNTIHLWSHHDSRNFSGNIFPWHLGSLL